MQGDSVRLTHLGVRVVPERGNEIIYRYDVAKKVAKREADEEEDEDEERSALGGRRRAATAGAAKRGPETQGALPPWAARRVRTTKADTAAPPRAEPAPPPRQEQQQQQRQRQPEAGRGLAEQAAAGGSLTVDAAALEAMVARLVERSLAAAAAPPPQQRQPAAPAAPSGSAGLNSRGVVLETSEELQEQPEGGAEAEAPPPRLPLARKSAPASAAPAPAAAAGVTEGCAARLKDVAAAVAAEGAEEAALPKSRAVRSTAAAAARLAAINSMIVASLMGNTLGCRKVDDVEGSGCVFLEGSVRQIPGFTYAHELRWGGERVPDASAATLSALQDAGAAVSPSLEEVLRGRVPFGLWVGRSLIPGGKGFGVVAMQPIPAGACVLRYDGEYLYETEYQKRVKAARAAEVGNGGKGPRAARRCYFWEVGSCMVPAAAAAARPAWQAAARRAAAGGGGSRQRGPGWLKLRRSTVDAAPMGSASRFLNHSCRPNLLSQEIDLPHGPTIIVLFARRGIAAVSAPLPPLPPPNAPPS
jgi:hypothetical protein